MKLEVQQKMQQNKRRSSKKVVVIGDIMLDHYIKGHVQRISPEAPVPVVRVVEDEYRLGGAANTANNLATLGQEVYLIGLVNHDDAGKKIDELCQKNKVLALFYNDDRPTIVKQRIIALGYNQQLLRVDREKTHNLPDKIADQILEQLDLLDPTYIVISDYAKGVISSYLIQKMKTKYKNKMIIDTKPNHLYMFKGCFILKPNLKELAESVGKEIDNNDQEVVMAARELIDKYEFSYIIVTRSEKGATLISKQGLVRHFSTKVEEVHDVTGAGDTFIAALTYALTQHDGDLIKAVRFAIKASSISVTKVGTSTVSLDEVKRFPFEVVETVGDA